MPNYDDDSILRGIFNGDEDVLKFVYREYFQTIKGLIIRNKGNDQDAEDVFQDGMVIVFQRLQNGGFILECSFKTFLYSVCRNLWLQRLEKLRTPVTSFADFENHISLSDEMMFEIYDLESEKYRLFQRHFLKLSKDCQKVLKLFMSKASLKEIAEEMGFKTEKYAKTRKFLCKEILKKNIISDPKWKKIFNR